MVSSCGCGPGCWERREANFQQHSHNGMCVSVSVCVFCEHTHLAQWIWCN